MIHKTISRYCPFKEKNGCDFDAYSYGIYHSNSHRSRRVGVETVRRDLLPSNTEAGISKNYCATNSGSPEVELRFCQ
jgi:hypothetical protein